MADHALGSRAEVASQAVDLRAELKSWEKAFSLANNGKKAGREDIKQNADIAAKYKEYGRLKSLESALARRENQRHEAQDHSKKRKHASPTGPESHVEFAPRKSAKGIFATPSHKRTTNAHPSQLDPYDSPSTLRKLFSPSTHQQNMPAPSPLKAAIGPTPQRDGKTLGLFDLLSESGGSAPTPSGKKQANTLAAAFRTPSKRKTVDRIPEAPEEEQQEETPRMARTPASSTKQFYLANLFATPTTMRYAAMVEAEDRKEAEENRSPDLPPPAAPGAPQSETPSFLRRSNSGRYPAATANQNGPGLSPVVSRKPLQFASKGLSHLVQGLRDMEEERMDDEWDVLRELEEEQEAGNIEIEDSQVPQQEHRPLYKKKGQKRTTRRVIMRPVASRPKPTAPAESDYEDESEDVLAAVPETQKPSKQKDNDDADLGENDEGDATSLHTMSEPDLDSNADPEVDFDGDSDYEEQSKPIARSKSFSERIKEAVTSAVKSKPKDPTEKKLGAPEKKEKKPQSRKINPQTHANFRALKIRNRGSKTGGRFRRR
ncbi:hypothetical protein N7474_005689 [Penicillium riverlandense]|uniref:uncharacterized protein n=1 Tax=Penicillium riverlandense TaxID=1903569 RepID=UPI00254679FC|nr:uncharacterized protein N7474_005689 [Penicillium riverlandense]KAJ5820098.1 hypothetical protein N7474_005689 [Penicillium riverlandense]